MTNTCYYFKLDRDKNGCLFWYYIGWCNGVPYTWCSIDKVKISELNKGLIYKLPESWSNISCFKPIPFSNGDLTTIFRYEE